MKVFLFILATLYTTFCRANDCIPLTLTTLSRLARENISYTTWRIETMRGDNPATLADTLTSWKRHSNLELTCVRSIYPKIVAQERGVIFDVPYLWIGNVRSDMATTPSEIDHESHAALVYFYSTFVYIVHTLPTIPFYYVERINYNELFERTFIIYEISAPSKGWVTFPVILFKP